MPRLLPVFCALLALTLLCAPKALADDEAATEVVLDSPEAVKKAMAHREAPVRLAAARAAAGLQDHLLTAPLVKLLKDKEPVVRQAAIEALRGRVEKRSRKSAALGLGNRLKAIARDEQMKAEVLLVVNALHILAQEVTIKTLLDVTVNDDKEVVRERAMAVANVPCDEAVDRLLQLASQGRRRVGWGGVVRAALRYATGADLPKDVDAWRNWWRDIKDDFDFEAAAARRAEERAEKARKAEAAEEKRRKREEKQREKEEKRRQRDEGKEKEDQGDEE